MKQLVFALLLMSPIVTAIAVAQDGGGHGPPHTPIIVVPAPTTLPTVPSSALPLGSSPKLAL